MWLIWVYGIPGDSDVGVRRPHFRDMEHVWQSFRMLFFFHQDQLNLAGGDGMAMLVVIHILSEQLKERNRKEQSESKSLHIMCQFAVI